MVGKYTSIALDANGYPHISYYDNVNLDLKYARWDGTSWQIQTVDSTGDVGWHTSIAIDSKGNPHISYSDHTNTADKDLKYAYWDGSQWKIQIVHKDNNAGGRNKLVLDTKDLPHIGYCESVDVEGVTHNRVAYTYWDGSQWNFKTIIEFANSSSAYPSMDLDSNNYAHFCFYNYEKQTLQYAHWDGTQWLFEDIENNKDGIDYTDIAIDSKNLPHVVYTINQESLKYATSDGTTWTTTVVDQGENLEFMERVSIAVDSNNLPHLAYWEYDSKDLRYAYFDGSKWQIQIVDQWGKVGSFACITVSAKNYPHISYLYKSESFGRSDFGSLRYAYISEEPIIQKGWQYRNIDDGGVDIYVGHFGAMLLDPNDYPHVVYVQVYGPEGLKYAYWDGSQWNIQTLSTQEIWGKCGIAMDTNRKIHISYKSEGYLMYITNKSGSWESTQVAVSGDGATCLLLDSNQYPHIVYSDDSVRDICYAYFNGTSWQTQLVDGTDTNMCGNPSFVLDSKGNAHVTYYDGDNRNLRYAHWDGSQWNRVILDTEQNYGKYSALKLGAGDTLHLSYTSDSQGDITALKYAYFDGSAWTFTIVDNSGSFYNFISLQLDTNGYPHISYYEYIHKDLKYASFNPTTRAWETEVADSSGNEGKQNCLALDRNNDPHITYIYTNNWDNNHVLKYAVYLNKNNLIQLLSFSAKMDENQVLINWETGAEINNAGFYLWRSDKKDGVFVKLNDVIIPSEGGSTWGALYSYRDPEALHGQTYYYKLEDIDYQGKSTMHGPIQIVVQK